MRKVPWAGLPEARAARRLDFVDAAYECELLSDPAPDMDEIVELGWFPREAIAALPRRDWIDRVIRDAPQCGR
ncbi:hypothetical protein [Microbacterium paraoxydans]|uniref:hypothetical protein n=1 Tax=Microbacterium paraoxydans TaxID=199592 RepID=UPI0030140F18